MFFGHGSRLKVRREFRVTKKTPDPSEKPKSFEAIERSDAKRQKASKRIRGRMREVGASVNEVPPEPKGTKKKGKHRKET